jgi:hypothetical protein
MSTALIFAAILAAIVVPILAIRRRATLDKQASDRSLVRIVIPPGASSCTAVRALQSYRFPRGEAPHLPLNACSLAGECQCNLRPAPERRGGERVPGEETREAIRPDPNGGPRRRPPRRGYGKLWRNE